MSDSKSKGSKGKGGSNGIDDENDDDAMMITIR